MRDRREALTTTADENLSPAQASGLAGHLPPPPGGSAAQRVHTPAHSPSELG